MNSSVKKIVKNFFNRFFWRQHPEAALRYLPLVSEIKKAKLLNSKILEIGSGSLGIVPYLKRKIDGIDIDFSGPQTELVNQIRGRADDLPFRKNSYDVIVSADVLEHIEKAKREKTIYEMLRVAQKLAVLAVPCGENAQNQDEKLQRYWNRIFKKRNEFLEEHLKNGLPKTDEILVYIDKSLRKLNKVAKVRSYPNLNLFLRSILMKTWITKSKYIYYFYLKGYLLFLPILKLCNFGNCYRRIFVIEFTS